MLGPVTDGGREQARTQFQGLQTGSEVGDHAVMVLCIGRRGLTIVKVLAGPSHSLSPSAAGLVLEVVSIRVVVDGEVGICSTTSACCVSIDRPHWGGHVTILNDGEALLVALYL